MFAINGKHSHKGKDLIPSLLPEDMAYLIISSIN